MKFFGGILLAAGFLAIALGVLVALGSMAATGAALSGAGGALLLLGAVLFGCGSITERLDRMNLLLMDIRNQGCAEPGQRISWKMIPAAQAARLGRWPETDW